MKDIVITPKTQKIIIIGLVIVMLILLANYYFNSSLTRRKALNEFKKYQYNNENYITAKILGIRDWKKYKVVKIEYVYWGWDDALEKSVKETKSNAYVYIKYDDGWRCETELNYFEYFEKKYY